MNVTKLLGVINVGDAAVGCRGGAVEFDAMMTDVVNNMFYFIIFN